MAIIKIPPERIRNFISKHFDFKERHNGDELIICNPLNGDSGYHFNISLTKGVCHDWRGDEWSGSVNPKTGKRSCSFIRFVSLYLKCTTGDAIKAILDGVVLEVAREEKAELKEYEIELPAGNEKLSALNDDRAKILKRWLRSRGYEKAEVEAKDLRCKGTSVIWPYYEFEALVYWQSRSYLNKRFLFPESEVYEEGKLVGKRNASKGMFLYGLDDVEFNDYLIIVEAIFDQHTLGEQAVASGGAILTNEQIQKIRMINPKKGIILAPDNDGAGYASAVSNYHKLLSLNIPLFYSVFDTVKHKAKDWNELFTDLKLSKSEIRTVFDESIKKLNEVNVMKLSKRVNDMARQKNKI